MTGQGVLDRARKTTARHDRAVGSKLARLIVPALLALALWAVPAHAKPDDLTQAVEAVRNRASTRADIQVIARSAHAGNPAACELVAWMLATGTAVPQDRRLAFSWYIEAYQRGLRQSLRDARIVFDRMNLAEKANIDSRLLVFLKADAPPPGGALPGRPDSLTAQSVRQVVREEAARAQFPTQLAEAVAYVESRFTPNAVSPKGARGVMQIMPSTAAGFSTDADALFDIRTNYVGGTAAGAAYPFVTDEVKSYVDDVLTQQARYQQAPLPGPRAAPVP
jgi:TPR repeat protein